MERTLHIVHTELTKRKNFWVSIMSLGVDPGGDGKRLFLEMLIEKERMVACSQGTIPNLVTPICKKS